MDIIIGPTERAGVWMRTLPQQRELRGMSVYALALRFSDFPISLLLLCPTRGAAVRYLWLCNDTGTIVRRLLLLSSSLFRPLKELTPVLL